MPQPFARQSWIVASAIVLASSGGPLLSATATPEVPDPRQPATDAELRFWLENMVWHHHFSTDEIRAATGLSEVEIRAALDRFNIRSTNRPTRLSDAPLLVLPYPGGRHPRIGFLDGAVDPQRETKVSVFTPWDPDSYVVVDAPEAIWSNLGLTYLAHTHVPTVWTKQNLKLPQMEWNRRADGTFDLERTLPNGISFGTRVRPGVDGVRMEMWLRNGTLEILRDLRVQNCVMLKGATGFNAQTNANKVLSNPYVACRSDKGRRWIITGWEPCDRPWANPPVPCLHSDPKFPDCPPGETRRLRGWLSFYEGDDVQSEFKRLDSLGWRTSLESASQSVAPFFGSPTGLQPDSKSYRNVLQFDDGRTVVSPSDWQERRQEILKYWHTTMGAWPALIKRPKVEWIGQQHRENFTQHRLRIEIARARTEEAWLLVPDGPGPFPAVLVPYYEPESSIGWGSIDLRDFGRQLARRNFVTLSIGSPGGDARKPDPGMSDWQPLSFLAYVAANCANALASLPYVDSRRIGIVGHSYGGKWALFAACLSEKFACGVWSDPGVVFDEARPDVNYWDPWYLGRDPDRTRSPGLVTSANPRTGAYRQLVESGHDLHELQALMPPRAFLVSGGSEDLPRRWLALKQVVDVYRILGETNRMAMTTRPGHSPTEQSNEQIYAFLESSLGGVTEDSPRPSVNASP